MTEIRTRFAPSPTGFLHIGGVRTALYCWAFARKHGGKFILRIEDTDLERSTEESVRAILDGMHWVGLDYDEGPFYQTKRFDRYKEMIAQLLDSSNAYYCYCSKEELEAMRNAGHSYDRRWRPEAGKTLPPIPEGVLPVVRFKMPTEGVTAWHDLVKGDIAIDNAQLDDLIIARADGTPTYNFCVVIDDWDMRISHVIRGDDHVNNTPKQINMLRALGGVIPHYAHLPMILNESGSKMSKRRDPVSVVEYDKQGFLPEAMLNYLARLGWGHGDDEFFTMEAFIKLFELSDVSSASGRFNKEKLLWLNAEHIKQMPNDRLIAKILPRMEDLGVSGDEKLSSILDLVKERSNNLNDLAAECAYFYRKATPSEAEITKHWDSDAPARMRRFADQLAHLADWNAETIHSLFAPFCESEGIKMGKLGMPLRIAVCGTGKTPSIDAVLALIGKEEVLKRLAEI